MDQQAPHSPAHREVLALVVGLDGQVVQLADHVEERLPGPQVLRAAGDEDAVHGLQAGSRVAGRGVDALAGTGMAPAAERAVSRPVGGAGVGCVEWRGWGPEGSAQRHPATPYGCRVPSRAACPPAAESGQSPRCARCAGPPRTLKRRFTSSRLMSHMMGTARAPALSTNFTYELAM